MIQFSLGHRVFLDLRQDIDRKEGEGKKFQSIESCVEESYMLCFYNWKWFRYVYSHFNAFCNIVKFWFYFKATLSCW